jgi:hypothetical protein
MQVNLFGKQYTMNPVDGNMQYMVGMFTNRFYPGKDNCGLTSEEWINEAIFTLDMPILGRFLDLLLRPEGHFFRVSTVVNNEGYVINHEDFQTITTVLAFFGKHAVNSESRSDKSPKPSVVLLPKPTKAKVSKSRSTSRKNTTN